MKVRDAMAKTVSGASRADTVARLVELMKKEDELRKKLEAHGPRLIQTVRGVGYVMRS